MIQPAILQIIEFMGVIEVNRVITGTTQIDTLPSLTKYAIYNNNKVIGLEIAYLHGFRYKPSLRSELPRNWTMQ